MQDPGKHMTELFYQDDFHKKHFTTLFSTSFHFFHQKAYCHATHKITFQKPIQLFQMHELCLLCLNNLFEKKHYNDNTIALLQLILQI